MEETQYLPLPGEDEGDAASDVMPARVQVWTGRL
jgi:hypothetical protein